jgi:hypothetical protein
VNGVVSDTDALRPRRALDVKRIRSGPPVAFDCAAGRKRMRGSAHDKQVRPNTWRLEKLIDLSAHCRRIRCLPPIQPMIPNGLDQLAGSIRIAHPLVIQTDPTNNTDKETLYA